MELVDLLNPMCTRVCRLLQGTQENQELKPDCTYSSFISAKITHGLLLYSLTS